MCLYSCKNYPMNGNLSNAPDSGDVLRNFIEIFTGNGWLNKNIAIVYQNKRYRISCNEERFFAYQINENGGHGPGVPGWPVCIIKNDSIFDESGIPDFEPESLTVHDWLNLISAQNFEVV